MNAAYILGLSVLLQGIAVFKAIRLIPLTGRRWAWILIAVALLLIIPRRCIAIYTMVYDPHPSAETMLESYVNLGISLCLLAGVWLIAPMFRQFAQAQKALKESEATARRQTQELEQIYRYAPIGLAVLDRDLRYLRVNEMLAKNLGRTVEELQGKTLDEVVPELMPHLRELYAPVLNEGRPVLEVEILGVRSKDGSVRDRLGNYFPLKSDTGEVIGMIAAGMDITDRKRAEAALRDSEEKYKRLVETTGTGYVILGDNGLVADANLEYVRMTGRQRPEEILGRSVLEWTAPHDIERNDRAVKKCLAQGFVHDLEIDYVMPGGQVTPIEINATVLHAADTVQILTLCRDITDRKRAGNALRESEYFFKESQRAAFTGSYKCDFTADCWESSEVLDRIFGIDRCYIRNTQSWLEIVHPEDRGMMARYLREEVIANRKPFRKEYRIIRKSDGEVRWVNGLGEIKFDIEGKVLSMMGTIRDITERKQAEEALRKAKDELEQRVAERTAELSQSRERLVTLFRTSPFGIFLSRLEDGRLLEVNDAYRHILGYSPEEMIGRTTLELGIFVNPDDRKRSIEILKKDGRNENTEVQYRHKSGRIVHLLINALPVNVDGVPCILGTSLDITERKQAEEALRTAAHKLIAVREEERRRVATDLHDSLAQGLVAMQLALHASNLDPAMEQCDRLIHEVRELCRGLYPAVLERLGLAEGLTQLAEAYEPSVSVTVEYPPPLADTRFDKDLEISLYRVAQEAINNAVRHGKAGQIEVELALSDGHLGLSVTDDGGGFDVAGQSSSGLGLMTMKDRIASIGGTLDIASKPGQTVVRATVPLPKDA